MNKEAVRISAKNLGVLAMPDCCKRCFWIKLKLNFRLPYQIFPGIFSSIDSYSKRITWAYFRDRDRLPVWLDDFEGCSNPVRVPHYSRFNVTHRKTNVTLTGTPDEIFQRIDGSFYIIDYKTAKFTARQDELLPMYEVQLNSYAFIAEASSGYEFKPVTGLGLVYYEPQTDIARSTPLDMLLLHDGFNMQFRAHLLKLDVNPNGIVVPLLREVRRLADSRKPPKGNDSCGDCHMLEQVIHLAPPWPVGCIRGGTSIKDVST